MSDLENALNQAAAALAVIAKHYPGIGGDLERSFAALQSFAASERARAVARDA